MKLLKKLSQRVQEVRTIIIDPLKQTVTKVEKQSDAFENDARLLRQSYNELLESTSEIKIERDNLRKDYKTVKEELDDHKIEVEKLNDKIDHLGKQLAEYKSETIVSLTKRLINKIFNNG